MGNVPNEVGQLAVIEHHLAQVDMADGSRQRRTDVDEQCALTDSKILSDPLVMSPVGFVDEQWLREAGRRGFFQSEERSHPVHYFCGRGGGGDRFLSFQGAVQHQVDDAVCAIDGARGDSGVHGIAGGHDDTEHTCGPEYSCVVVLAEFPRGRIDGRHHFGPVRVEVHELVHRVDAELGSSIHEIIEGKLNRALHFVCVGRLISNLVVLLVWLRARWRRPLSGQF